MEQRFRNFIIILLVLILPNIFLAQSQSETTSKFPVLKGPCLGQKPPGMNPEVFAPGIISTNSHERCSGFTKDGTLYFFKRSKDPEGEADIYRSGLVDRKYTKVENLGEIINTKYNDLDGFIALDESYLIFCSDRPGGYGNSDFYISFQKNDNSWTEPVNMGEKINNQ